MDIYGIDYSKISFSTQNKQFDYITKTGVISEQTLSETIEMADDIKEVANSDAIFINWNGAVWPSDAQNVPTVINSTSDLIKAIKYASQVGGGGEDGATPTFPLTIVAYYSDTQEPQSDLGMVSSKQTFSINTRSFAINDDSISTKFTVNRTTEAKYSIIAWPTELGKFEIPNNYVNRLYSTQFEGKTYYAIASTVPSKAFVPIVVK